MLKLKLFNISCLNRGKYFVVPNTESNKNLHTSKQIVRLIEFHIVTHIERFFRGICLEYALHKRRIKKGRASYGPLLWHAYY